MPTKANLSFEEYMHKLEELVAKMEAGELSLEQSLKAYEEGNALVKSCRSLLDKAEVTVTKIGAQSNSSNQNLAEEL